MLKRCFSSRLSPFARKLLYQSFVKPHLEYGVSAIFPRTRGELNRLIRVERWYTRMATTRPAPYYNRLHSLGLLPLRSRFLEKDVRWLWNEFRAKSYFFERFCHLRRSASRLCRPHTLEKQRSSRLQRVQTLSTRVTNVWNLLPREIINASSARDFTKCLRAWIITSASPDVAQYPHFVRT